MTKPYSLDLRERVTERVAAGDSVRAVATIFTVSVASVVRWSQRLRRTGSAAGGKMGGHRACTLIGERGWLMERIAAEPEVTVRGLMTELAERGVAVSYGTVWNFIHREGMSFKKKRAAGRARSPRSPMRVQARWPPIFPPAALPVLRSRCDQRTTLATLTVKIVATARTLSPAATRSVTLSRRSNE